MVDPRRIREDPEWYRREIEKRQDEELLKAFDKFLEIDKEWRELKREADSLRAERNKISLEINKKKKKGEDIQDLLRKAKEIPGKLKEIEEKEKQLEEERYELLLLLPSPLDEDVPIGGENDYVVLRYYGKPKVYKDNVGEFKKENDTGFETVNHAPLGHYDLVEKLGIVDMDNAARIAGSRFYIEKNELVILDLAIIMHALKFFQEKGFKEIVLPPYMIKHDVEKRITHYETFKDAIFHVKEDGLLLITTSEHPIAAMYIDKTLNKNDLPLRILAWSPAFRREAGSHGKDTKGIFRVKQFHKVELHSIVPLDKDREELDYLVGIVEEYMQQLGLPYRVVKLASSDVDKRARIQIDIETWFPAQNKYRETHSVATVGDWISRKINLKIGKDYAANLYATGVAVQRIVCAILENNYDPERKIVKIPKVLWPYTGFKEIKIKY